MPGISFTPLIVGCGDVGTRLGNELVRRGARPVGLVRRQQSADRLGRTGIVPALSNLDRPIDEPPAAADGGTVFYLVPPDAEVADDDPRLHNFLAACEQAVPRQFVYLGTSGVYGDCHGEWVDESRAPDPQSDRARRRLAAERIVSDWCRSQGVEHLILRVGGIYGPGRLPLDRLAGMTVICPDEAPWSNRIHVDDLVQTLVAAARHGRNGQIYNVADGHPTTMTDYLYRVADIAGMARPPCVPLAEAPRSLSPGMLSFVRESRRLDTRRLREELGVRLRFPTLDTGLPDAWHRTKEERQALSAKR